MSHPLSAFLRAEARAAQRKADELNHQADELDALFSRFKETGQCHYSLMVKAGEANEALGASFK